MPFDFESLLIFAAVFDIDFYQCKCAEFSFCKKRERNKHNTEYNSLN